MHYTNTLHMKKYLLLTSVLLLACTAVSAQGSFLKKLGEKVEQAVSKKVGDALYIARLDAELESMGAAEKKTSSWASAKSMAATLNGLVISYASMPHLLFDCPLVRHAWED